MVEVAKRKFTSRLIASLKPPAVGQLDIWDASLPGFGMRLSAGGRRTWVVMYRLGSRKYRYTLGTHPAMALAQARSEAKAALAMVQTGGDPMAEKRARREAESFGQLAGRYIEKHAKPNKKSWSYDQECLDRDVLPILRNRQPADIAKRDIKDIIGKIVDQIGRAHV